MTSSEILCFIRLFGVIVGDLVNEDNPYWQLYLLMRKYLILYSQKDCQEVFRFLFLV